MKKLLRKRTVIVGLILVSILLVPYLWSRICSPSQIIRVIEIEDGAFEPTDRLRVAVYNIAHGRGLARSNWDGGDASERLNRLEEIAKLLIKLDADVVVLNEVDFDTSWSNHVNQAKLLAEKAGYPNRVEQRNLDFRLLHRTWRFGNAILSRYPISNAEVVDLPSYSSFETALAGKKRGVSCDVAVGEQVYRIIGLHMSHRSEETRELSARRVVELIQECSFPCIVLGDMNSTPPDLPDSVQTASQQNAISTFDDSGLIRRSRVPTPVPPHELTFPSDDPKRIIDWIFVSKSLDFEQYSVESSLLSDHRPVVAVVAAADEPQN